MIIRKPSWFPKKRAATTVAATPTPPSSEPVVVTVGRQPAVYEQPTEPKKAVAGDMWLVKDPTVTPLVPVYEQSHEPKNALPGSIWLKP